MADWKQITARIRRARGSRDPAGQLAQLYEKTSDAMVAFELGRHFEITKNSEKSLEWYLVAVQRFRRGDWKNKAREAVVRMGGEVPSETEADLQEPNEAASAAESNESSAVIAGADSDSQLDQATSVDGSTPSAAPSDSPDSAAQEPSEAAAAPADHSPRRRGRRGGRNRRKGRAGDSAQESHKAPVRSSAARHLSGSATKTTANEPEEIVPPRVVDRRAIPRIPVEPIPESSGPAVRGRFGDPGLSSRLTLLEQQLRRLLTCSPAKLEDSAQAPAGPGVFVLTDDEMTTYYYVEACDTLRIAINSLSRTGMTRRGNTNLKSLLAENLGISEARAAKYLADHCVVRWLQLDEGSTNFHHFAIAVLRPILNE